MVEKKGLPEELAVLLRQLVMNGQHRIGGMLLYAYCRRVYGADERTASRWIQAYFHREFPMQMNKHRKQALNS